MKHVQKRFWKEHFSALQVFLYRSSYDLCVRAYSHSLPVDGTLGA